MMVQLRRSPDGSSMAEKVLATRLGAATERKCTATLPCLGAHSVLAGPQTLTAALKLTLAESADSWMVSVLPFNKSLREKQQR